MKKYFLFMSVLASLFLAGCSQEEIAPDGEDNGSGEANTSYMAVNLMSSDVKGTRAAAGYEDGSVDENNVEKVRFYFFTANGAIAPVKFLNGSYVNYYDWTPGEKDQKEDVVDTDDTESVLNATIVISTKDGDKLPQSIAAVLNPTGLKDKSMNLTELKGVVTDYADPVLTSKGKFVMFNSVYGKDKAEVCAVPIESTNLQKTPGNAEKNPITIYVERSVAKVKVSLGTDVASASSDKLQLADKDGNDLKVGGEQVYLKLGGWSLTAETTEGRLVKAIDPTWASDWWNGSGAFAHRSFWAINSKDAANKYSVNYNDITTLFTTAKYTNENALDYDTESPINRTKVILKGQLCKADGSNFTIVRHLGAHFADTYSETPADNLPALKANILSQLTANGYNYYLENEQTRTGLSANDLKIVIATQDKIENSKNNCYVYAQLTDEAAQKTWYNSLDKTVTTTITASEINNNLKDKDIVDWALVWKDGMTYYYYEIIHYGIGENATKGVVRNHIYDTKITKIAGLGTPVYNPDEVIYPEKPDENNHYIAAEINILSWRIVSNEYALEW